MSQSKDPAVNNTALTVTTGKWWNPREAFGTLDGHRMKEQGLGLADRWKAWGKATLPDRRH